MGNLVLTRRIGEKLMINDDKGEVNVVVSIMGVRGSQVKISIMAPDNVAIDREEIYNLKNNIG